MHRSEWKFEYRASDVCGAAGEKLKYHLSRLDFWTKKKEECLEKVKSESIQIDESVATNAANVYNNSYRQESVSIRNDYVKDLQETVQKVSEHKVHVKHYDSWVQILKDFLNKELELTYDDWVFFFQ